MLVGLDAGGSLIKVLLKNCVSSNIRDPFTSHALPYISLTGYFDEDITLTPFLFDVDDFESAIRLIKSFETAAPIVIKATGGGAFRLKDIFEASIFCTFVLFGEMEALVKGLLCELSQPKSIFGFDREKDELMQAGSIYSDLPILLVNIGSGVSILKIRSETEFCRVSGTPIGGGTCLGLVNTLFGNDSYEKLIEKHLKERSSIIDLFVDDLTGRSCVPSGMPDSCLGNIDYFPSDDASITRSVLDMVSYNVGYIAYLVAHTHGISQVYFSGKFVHKHPITIHCISSGLNGSTRSRSSRIKATFLDNEGFIGAIGAIIS
jgi:pantothenate kinase